MGDLRIFGRTASGIITEELKKIKKTGSELDMNKRLAKRLCLRGLKALPTVRA